QPVGAAVSDDAGVGEFRRRNEPQLRRVWNAQQRRHRGGPIGRHDADDYYQRRYRRGGVLMIVNRNKSRGFTLAEVAVSMVILSIVTAAVASAILLVSRAIPDNRSSSGAVVATNRAADQLSTELYYAQSVTAMSPTSITF